MFPLPGPIVKRLLISNIVIFFVSAFMPGLIRVFGLVPVAFWRGAVWQVFTYMFFHGSMMHIFFNMFALWMFGTELEYRWGSRAFVWYYVITGVGAGLVTVLFWHNSPIPVIGASGAIYGILLAYGLTFPNRIILIGFLFPMPAKYVVVLFGMMEFFSLFSMDGVAHITHLGGLFTGLAYLYFLGRGPRPRRIRVYPPKKDTDLDAVDLAELDRLLDKIAREGMESLSPQEKEFLDYVSKRLGRRWQR